MDIVECSREVAEKPEQRDIVCSHIKFNKSLEVDPMTAQALREYLAVVWDNYLKLLRSVCHFPWWKKYF
jgi:hypothetical protein